MKLKGQTQNTKLTAILAIVLSTLVPSSQSLAGGTRNQVVKICEQTPTLNQQTLKSARGSECGAAKEQLNAKNSNTAGSAIWAAVTVVCASACAQKGSGGSNCTYASQAATGIQEGLSKNYAAALTPLAKKDSSAIQKSAAGKISKETSKNSSSASEACMSAANSSLSAFQKAGSAGKSGTEIKGLYKESKKLDGEEGSGNKNVPTVVGDSSSLQTQPNSGNIPGENVHCREEKLKTAIGALACAARTDPSLPPSIKNGGFLKELEKVTGQPADQFFKDFKDPATAISTALAGSLDSAQSEKLGKVLSALDRATGASQLGDDSSIAVASGGSGKSGDTEPELDINALLQKMLGQTDEEGKSEDPASEASKEAFKVAERKLASITAENSSVSIFDRIKWRYLILDRKQDLGGLKAK